MSQEQLPLSNDELAARAAEQMLKSSGGQGDMPRGEDAEGGFRAQAGGTAITAKGQKGKAAMTKAGAYTDDDVTSEPKRMGREAQTSAKATNEPGREAGPGGAGKNGENLDQEEDEPTRKRKDGYSANPGDGGGQDQTGDEPTRARKDGKVGISKAKADEEDEEEEGEEEEDGMKMSKMSKKDMKDMKYKKSEADEIGADDLMKSLRTLEAIAEGSKAAVEDRRIELAEKLAQGELSKSDALELNELLIKSFGDEEEAEAAPEPAAEENAAEVEAATATPIAKSYQEQFATDDQMQKDYDASPFLERTSQIMAASLDQVQDSLTKSMQEKDELQKSFNVQLAKSLRSFGTLVQGQKDTIEEQSDLIKSLTDRLEVVETSPLPRKSRLGTAEPIQKSFGGQVQEQLGREQILDGLIGLAEAGQGDPRQLMQAPCGESLDKGIALYENSGQISKSLYNDVVNFYRGGRN